MSENLTQEQRDVIARNRAEAMRRLEERKRRLAAEDAMAAYNASATTAPPPSGGIAVIPSLLSGLPTKKVYSTDVRPPNAQWGDSSSAFIKPLMTVTVANDLPQTSRQYSPIVKVTFLILDVMFTPFHMDIVDVIKTLPSRKYNDTEKFWSIRFSDYNALVTKLRSLNNVRCEVEELPPGVKQVFKDEISGREPKNKNVSLNGIDEHLVNALFPYQKRGILFGLEKEGRVLIADEMGLGKSIQALGIAHKYVLEWPLLIVCPSSVKYAWRNEMSTWNSDTMHLLQQYFQQINRFLPTVKEVFMIDRSCDILPRARLTSIVVIMSYEQMCSRLRELVDHVFYVVIFDESHFLKEMKAKRTKCATELARKANRVLLLSGTPALSRPVELYSQLKILNPLIFPSYMAFGTRYCAGRQGRFGYEMKGTSNSEELATILSKTVMIRRLKKDVLDDLPPKRREIIYLSGNSIDHRMKALREAREALLRTSEQPTNSRSKNTGNKRDKHECLMDYYVQTAIVKSQSVAGHIVEGFFYDGAERRKVLIFAHHQVVLDSITLMVARKNIKYIRIDGQTAQRERGVLCERFQNEDDVLVAILSITAAGVGITLTAASCVVFAELHWNPGTMLQAEDRAHRVGQKDSVLVQYVLAKNTADDEIWPLIEKKLRLLGSVNLSSDSYKDAENLHRACGDRAITSYFQRLSEEDKDGNNNGDKTDGGLEGSVNNIIDNDDDDIVVEIPAKRKSSSETSDIQIL